MWQFFEVPYIGGPPINSAWILTAGWLSHDTRLMPPATETQLRRYYRLFGEQAIVFTRPVTTVTGLVAKRVYMKCGVEKKPCVLYSSSMVGAKVIADIDSRFLRAIKKANNSIYLHLTFQPTRGRPAESSLVAGRVDTYSPYRKEGEDSYYYVNILYTRRPPEHLIEKFGKIIESKINIVRWQDVRITMFPRTMREIDLDSNDAIVEIDSKPIKCIIRDLSFNGARVVVDGVAKPALESKVILYIPFSNQDDLLKLHGEILRFSSVDRRPDATAVSIKFEEDTIPLAYSINLNEHLLRNNAE